MLNILLDTNILLDIAIPGRPTREESIMIVEEALYKELTAFVPATSLKDTYYILSKAMNEPVARNTIRSIMNVFTICPVNRETCERAFNSNEPDFEDGIVRACAEARRVDYIISRDVEAFKNSPIKCITPAEFIERCKEIHTVHI